MAEQRIITGVESFEALVGQTLGVSDWRLVDQDTVNAFGRTTGDEQWIHTDPERAADGPFGGTVAHGFLVLSLIPVLANQTFLAEGFGSRVNYGLEKVRFPQPLGTGESVRDTVSIKTVEQTRGGVMVAFGHELESTRGGRPVCVAETLTLFLP